MEFKYISLPIFLISFICGLIFIYILGPEKKTIYIYPTPDTIHKILYKDKSNTCFKLNKNIINCPKNIDLITPIPFQV